MNDVNESSKNQSIPSQSVPMVLHTHHNQRRSVVERSRARKPQPRRRVEPHTFSFCVVLIFVESRLFIFREVSEPSSTVAELMLHGQN